MRKNKQRRCEVGQSCGATCIAQSKTCTKELSANFIQKGLNSAAVSSKARIMNKATGDFKKYAIAIEDVLDDLTGGTWYSGSIEAYAKDGFERGLSAREIAQEIYDTGDW